MPRPDKTLKGLCALVLLLMVAPGARAAGTGNVVVAGSGCSIPDGPYPATLGTYAVQGGTLYSIGASFFAINQATDKTITGVYRSNFVFTFNTANQQASVNAPAGTSLNQFLTTYSGQIGPDSFVSYRVSVTLGCGQTISGEFVIS